MPALRLRGNILGGDVILGCEHPAILMGRIPKKNGRICLNGLNINAFVAAAAKSLLEITLLLYQKAVPIGLRIFRFFAIHAIPPKEIGGNT